MTRSIEPRPGPILAAAKFTLLLQIASLPLYKPPVPLLGYAASLTDGLFLVTGGLWALAVARGETRVRWNPFFFIVLAYFGALALSALASSDMRATIIKLATQVYLIALPLLAYNLIGSANDLRRALIAWLAGSAIPALIGIAAVLLFYLGVDRYRLDGALHEYGLLPPGPYPRVEATFLFPAMLCNYLTVSVFILFAARQRGWLDRKFCDPLLAAMIVTAAFTVTPGLGGFVLALGAWVYWSKAGHPFRITALTIGIAAAAASVPISTLTPIIHPTAPYLIAIPSLDLIFAPAVRLMTWTAAANVWLAHPVLGSGIGEGPIAVRFVDPSGLLHVLADAHNAYLNIAAQCGTIGLAALLLLIGRVARDTSRYGSAIPTPLPLVLGIAWLDGFAVQGFTGSYEDARHLWVLLGLWLASRTYERAGVSADPGKAARSGSTHSLRAETENSRSRE